MKMTLMSMQVWEAFAADTIGNTDTEADISRLIAAVSRAHGGGTPGLEEWVIRTKEELTAEAPVDGGPSTL